MRCEEVRELRLDWLRRRLGEGQRSEVRSHLDACPVCRAEFDEETRLDALLDRLPSLEAGPAFQDGVLRRIAAGARRQPLRLFRWAAAAAAVLLTGLLVLYQGKDSALSAEEMEIVSHLDVLEDMTLVESLDVLEESDAPEDLDMATDLDEEIW